jgi:hypothetical protein
MSECYPHFYCDQRSNSIQCDSDNALVYNEQSAQLVQSIAASLPPCPCSGHFKPGADPKGPVCHTPFKHQDDVVKRLTDPYIIILDGACRFSDEKEPYQVKID